MNIRECALPGIGVKYQFHTKGGNQLVIIKHEDGRRELYSVNPLDEEELTLIAELEDDECVTLSGLIGGWS
ncbi:hypothetical protein ACN9MH_12475 [Paenibacillus silvae]|jgi:TrkA domain protein|uniref:Potassium/proton antiporter subunit KhtT-like N-terminal domain-containing protein n=1 Tax=Paenibacillus silvae TaxID=1325358 RepID=A0A2W6PAL3_9BACL|nr:MULTISPECIES: hypothetical protein [Paenibacillus]MBU5351254.1 hypothetical protein [Paenibacillus barcinonensis]MCK6073771.1 hypothetical protein [Paenibacillus silvae]MCK6148753.1 hypothetical protein [Paenibacillus silvae]MCK6267053.1 hypothetical protein [Paenibacillus silvae]MDM5278122.1 hypothetical protein [Paenibacillus silvae]